MFFGKLIKLAQKEENLGSIGGKVQKEIEKKNPNLINTRYLIIAQGGFFSKNNKCTVSNKHVRAGFWTQKQ